MKNKLIAAISGVLVIVLIVCASIFFGHNTDKIDKVFSDTIEALDTEQGLKHLFLQNAVDNTKSIDKEIELINEFYKGKALEIKDYNLYRESSTNYRVYATVRTDEGEYFVCLCASGARLVDSVGLDQLIIEDSKEFEHKKIFKKHKFDKYIEHADEFGITIRFKGDNR